MHLSQGLNKVAHKSFQVAWMKTIVPIIVIYIAIN